MKQTQILTLATLLFGITQANAQQLSIDTRCFMSPDEQLKVEFKTYQDSDIGWVGGQLRYHTSQQYIPLVFKASEVVTELPDRPWEFKHTWLEIVDGQINGSYQYHSQGAVVFNFSYRPSGSDQVFDLSKNSHSVDQNGHCTWEAMSE